MMLVTLIIGIVIAYFVLAALHQPITWVVIAQLLKVAGILFACWLALVVVVGLFGSSGMSGNAAGLLAVAVVVVLTWPMQKQWQREQVAKKNGKRAQRK